MNEIYRSQFRLPQSVYELLKASADENRRSVNAELISRLESSFSKKERIRHKLGLPMSEPDDETDEFYEGEDSADEPPEELVRIGGRLTHYTDQRLAAIVAQVIKKLEEDEPS